jgi:hypothetical protein
MLSIDTNFPTFTGDEKLEDRVESMHSYMFMLVEKLRYMLRNLDMGNINTNVFENQIQTLLLGDNIFNIGNSQGSDGIFHNLITYNLFAEHGDIANLTVDRLRTLSARIKAAKFLANDLSDVYFLDIYEEKIRFYEGQVIQPLQAVHAETLDGEPLWWINGRIGGFITPVPPRAGEPRVPVMVYEYEEISPCGIAFEPIDINGTIRQTVVFSLGRGDRNGRRRVRYYTDGTNLNIEWLHSSGELYFIKIGEDGITTNPSVTGDRPIILDRVPNIPESEAILATANDGDLILVAPLPFIPEGG